MISANKDVVGKTWNSSAMSISFPLCSAQYGTVKTNQQQARNAITKSTIDERQTVSPTRYLCHGQQRVGQRVGVVAHNVEGALQKKHSTCQPNASERSDG